MWWEPRHALFFDAGTYSHTEQSTGERPPCREVGVGAVAEEVAQCFLTTTSGSAGYASHQVAIAFFDSAASLTRVACTSSRSRVPLLTGPTGGP
jgi:hypothetical protein